MNRAVLLYQLLRYMGPGWLAYRVRHAIEHRLGVLERKLPVTTWDKVEVNRDIANDWQSRCGRFLFTPEDREAYAPILRGFDDESIDWHARVEQIAAGKLSYFSNEPVEVGFPPKWNDNLLQGKPGPPMVHFSKINEFGCGDVKCIWEPSRFSFAYDLVRAYWRTGDERAGEVFWQAAEDWLENNPPNVGINWKCGQESTFRMMAWCFALFGFADCKVTTPERVLKALRLMRATGRRIEAHLGYALSQKNNHGISEAMGLFTIGLLFPFFEESKRWAELGNKHLESQARSLIYQDGGFAQHSANYHRVMLHDLLYAIRIGELNNQPLSDELKQRVGKAGRFIHAIMDTRTGRVPRYGQDDGALILPLAESPYEDYRPVVQTTASICSSQDLPIARGVWDESMLWLCGPVALSRGVSTETVVHEVTHEDAGCHVLRTDIAMAFVRAQRFRHRPSQLDQLHVDIWWQGVNVALDPGTYSYNAESEWEGIPFSKTAAHNTVMVEGKEQARQAGSRFLFLPWPQAYFHVIAASEDETVSVIDVAMDNRHCRRVIRIDSDIFVVLDTLVLSSGAMPSTLHWHLADAPHRFDASTGRLDLDYRPGQYSVTLGALEGALTFDLERAVEGSHVGWYSPRYMRAEPAIWLTAATAPGFAKLFSVFGSKQVDVRLDQDELKIAQGGKALAIKHNDWPGPGHDPFFTANKLANQWST